MPGVDDSPLNKVPNYKVLLLKYIHEDIFYK